MSIMSWRRRLSARSLVTSVLKIALKVWRFENAKPEANRNVQVERIDVFAQHAGQLPAFKHVADHGNQRCAHMGGFFDLLR